MAEEKIAWFEISGVSGILASIVGFTCILLAITFYPQFSWTNNALSDLGTIAGPLQQSSIQGFRDPVQTSSKIEHF